MFGLFSKTTDDSTWLIEARKNIDDIRNIAEVFEKAGKSVENDLVNGWQDVSDIMSTLETFQSKCKSIESQFKEIGSPQSSELKKTNDNVKKFLKSSFSACKHGKWHYDSVSGRAGQRAQLETGFAQKAALLRITGDSAAFVEFAKEANQMAQEIIATINKSP